MALAQLRKWQIWTGAWLVAVLIPIVVLAQYGGEPGPIGEAPATWPDDSGLERDAARPNLVMLAHPRCPCTRASVTELERIMARLGERAVATVLFVQPEGVEAGFTDTDLWRRVQAIPNVRAIVDPGGIAARRFGAATSGHLVAYDAEGMLLFAGGITPARGHEGTSAGRQRLLALLDGVRADRADAPVFGCELDEKAKEPSR